MPARPHPWRRSCRPSLKLSALVVLIWCPGSTAWPRGVQALKGTRTVDRYKLVWSPRPEFVRMAARYGATIVPFGAVGCEESVGAIMNAENTVRFVSALGRLQGRQPSAEDEAELQRMRNVKARRGVNAKKMFENELDIVRPSPLSCMLHLRSPHSQTDVGTVLCLAMAPT